MNKFQLIMAGFAVVVISSCGTLDKKTILIDAGYTKDKVISVMGVPQDRQLREQQEAWQYCVSGAGFGYNDHKIIWFNKGVVTGINSYRSHRSGCTGAIRSIKWEDAPDVVIETRKR